MTIKTKFILTFSAFLFCAPSFAQMPESIALTADDVSYNQKDGSVTATGEVKISGDQGTLWADSLLYNPKTGAIHAKGNVTYTNTDNLTVYLDSMELKDNLKMGVMEQLRVRIGGEGGPALAAERAEKTSESEMSLVNATYSPCQGCGDPNKELPWRIRASKITYDSEERKVSYRNAFLDVKGVPIVYLPYFKHPLGEQKGQSGMLPPRFGSSTNRGEEITVGYYHTSSPYKDYTFRARTMTTRGVQLQAEHRQISEKFDYEVRGSILEDDKTNSTRSHIETLAAYTFKPGQRIGLSSEVTSDDTYLDDFFDKNPTYLNNTLFAQDTSKNHFYNIQGTYFQDLRDGQENAQTGQVLPRIQVEKTFNLARDGEHITVGADALSFYRTEGSRSRRLATYAGYDWDMFTHSGNKITLQGDLRADVYHLENAGLTSEEESFQTRVVPQLSLTWERPFVSSKGFHKITPKVMAVASPRGGNPNEIINEDSVAYELDTTNLFDTNRFAGFDRIETGSRLVYGIDNRWGDTNASNWRFFLGQNIRMFDDEDLPIGAGTETKLSDWIGQAEVNVKDGIQFNTRFRLDNADFEARRMDTDLTLGDRTESYINLTHTLLDGGPEEVSAEARYKFTTAFSVEGEFRRDIRDGGKQLLSEGSLIYTAQCYRLSFTAQRRGYSNRSVPPSTNLLFNIELLTLGRDLE